MLESIYNNTYQKFVAPTNASLICKPYGVVTIEQIVKQPHVSEFCKKKYRDFLEHNPKSSYFVHFILHTHSFYHVQSKVNSECIISARGMVSYSELLLREGLAVVQKHFRDKEYLYRFRKAYWSAKGNKKGMFSDYVLGNCIEMSY